MNTYFQEKLIISSIIISLALLPGCSLFEKSSPETATPTTEEVNTENQQLSGTVVATINGTPAITSDSLNQEKATIFKSNPQIESAVAIMGESSFNRNLTDGLISQIVLDKEVVAKGLDQSAAYQAEYKTGCQAVKRMLNAKYFSQNIGDVKATDSEARAFYDENKDSVPGLLISQGGIVTSGLQFDDQETAQDFLNRVKAERNDFNKVAQQEELSDAIIDFKMVNKQSVGINVELRDRITALKSVPTVEMIVTNGGGIWVVNATSKEDPKYRAFDQIKDAIKQEIEKTKRMEQFETEINALKKKYNVVINEDFFKSSDDAEQIMNDELAE